MNKWGITVKCETEGQATNLAKLIKTQTGLEVNVKGGSSMCRHPPDKVKQYFARNFCLQCNQEVIRVGGWETAKGERVGGAGDDCLHPVGNVDKTGPKDWTGDSDHGECKRCGCEVDKVYFYLLPDLSDAPSKLPDLLNADGDAPGIDHLLVMPERVDDTAGRGELAEA